MNIEKLLSWISDWSVMLPFLIGIFFLNKLSKNTSIILVIVILSIIPQLMNAFDLKNQFIKNLAYNVYTPLEFICFYILFKQYIQGKAETIIFKILLFLYLFVSFLFIFSKNFTFRFFDEWACINNFAYTLWILFVFYKQYNLSGTIKIDTSTSIFWIMTGLLFYSSCSTLYFSVYRYAQQQSFSSLKIIHHLVNANMYVCFATAIYKDSFEDNRKDLSVKKNN